MVAAGQQAGIYLNRQSNRIRRVGVGVLPPEGSDWVLLSDDPNTGLVAARAIAQERGMSANPAAIVWE